MGHMGSSSRGGGLFSGRVKKKQAPPWGRFSAQIRPPWASIIARQIANYAAERGTTSVAFALAWVLKNRLVSATIAGPRTEAHWDSYMNALALQLTAEDEAFINSLVPPGHTSTPGYTDPGYPVEGRVI